MHMQTIYLVGPDVFEVDPISVGEALKALCSKFGFIGLFPLDNVIESHEHPHRTAEAIRVANLELIKKADIYDISFVLVSVGRLRLAVDIFRGYRTYLINYSVGVNLEINVAPNCDMCLRKCYD